MNLPIPNGYRFYGGADISVAVDAVGTIFYACNAFFPDGRFGEIVVKVINNVPEIVPLPEFVGGRGQLNWTPSGLYLATWHQADPKAAIQAKIFKIEQFNNNFVFNQNTTPGNTFTPVAVQIPGPRFTTPDTNDWVVTDELIRDKFEADAELLNAIREALIANKLAK